MTKRSEPDWSGIERLCRETTLPLTEIARTAAVPIGTLRARARKSGWRARQGAHEPAVPVRQRKVSPASRRTLIRRLYSAIDTKLKQMEQRMANEIARGEEVPASDHERAVRVISGLITQLGKISEFETDLDRPGGRKHDGPTASLAEEADRYRRDLTERLARLIRPPG